MVTKAEHAAYLAAMFDGEGSIALYYYKHAVRHVFVTNTDPDLVAAVVRCCDALGIKCSVKQQFNARLGKKPIFRVAVNGKSSFETLLREVPIQSQAKKAALEAIVASYVYDTTYTWTLVNGVRVYEKA